jgi:hypothetical protein
MQRATTGQSSARPVQARADCRTEAALALVIISTDWGQPNGLTSIDVIGSSDAKAGSSGIALVAEHRCHWLVGREARRDEARGTLPGDTAATH